MAHHPYREGAQASAHRHCLYCGAERDPRAGPCASCHATSVPEDESPGAEDHLLCPRCGVALGAAAITDGATLFRCEACLGCFVPERAFSTLMSRVAAGDPAPLSGFVPLPPGEELTTEKLVEVVSCPICARPAERINFAARSGVVVDVCGRHGIWFDAAEIVRVKQFVQAREQNGGVVPVSPEVRRTELEEERRSIDRRIADHTAAMRLEMALRGKPGRYSGSITRLLAELFR